MVVIEVAWNHTLADSTGKIANVPGVRLQLTVAADGVLALESLVLASSSMVIYCDQGRGVKKGTVGVR